MLLGDLVKEIMLFPVDEFMIFFVKEIMFFYVEEFVLQFQRNGRVLYMPAAGT